MIIGGTWCSRVIKTAARRIPGLHSSHPRNAVARATRRACRSWSVAEVTDSENVLATPTADSSKTFRCSGWTLTEDTRDEKRRESSSECGKGKQRQVRAIFTLQISKGLAVDNHFHFDLISINYADFFHFEYRWAFSDNKKKEKKY